jgi:radical SAM superfamily enzyme YgiQ (UPF0313 family)
MKKALIISYNLVRPGENPVPLSVASIIAFAKKDPEYGIGFEIDQLHLNLLTEKNRAESFSECFADMDFKEYDHIAISCFVWNEYLINPLIRFLRQSGFKNKIVLGGAQITYSNKDQLKYEYPSADIFILGYAEKSFLEILKGEQEKSCFDSPLDFNDIPSPYFEGNGALIPGQKMIRWETKRGCPFRCSFCAHRNLENGRVHYMRLEKGFEELLLFKQRGLKRINVLDPIFNIGGDYLEIMREIDRLNFQSTFTFQSKIELLSKNNGSEFLDLIEKTNSHLEFGLQTVIESEYKIIDRKNNVNEIIRQLDLLNQRQISYEVSLIYGLPNQTIDSFQRSIDFLRNKGCSNITAWPLMLLKGTPLFDERDKWNLQEEITGDFNIPVVTSSLSFNKDQWLKMQEIALNLEVTNRY